MGGELFHADGRTDRHDETICYFSQFCESPKTYELVLYRMRWRSWLRHCATSRKVAGSIPDGVTGIFQLLNTSGRIVALGSTQPLTEMSTRNSSWE